jgi:hypothetical protein
MKCSVPTKFVEMTYGPAGNRNRIQFFRSSSSRRCQVFSLYVLSEDMNTGYAVFSARWLERTPAALLPFGDITD